MTKLITLGNLGTFASEIKAKYARQSALEELQTLLTLISSTQLMFMKVQA